MSENNTDNNLKVLRKEKGLSLSEVSNKLKLTTDTIKKLEQGDFDGLGAYTYIRGYMIHYTSLLGVDAEPYLKMIPKMEIDIPLINTSASVTKGIKLKRQSKNMASYLMGTFLLLVICFSGWYLLKNYSNVSRERNNSIELTDNSSISTVVEEESLSVDQLKQSDEQSFHYSSLIPPNEEPQITHSSDEIQQNIDVALPPQQPVLGEIEQTSVNNDLNDEAQNALYQIVIEAQETSWVKVEKADGSDLHNTLLNPGRVVLESDEGLHFRIGNKNQVTVTINGQVVDLAKYSRKDIADFNWPIDG